MGHRPKISTWASRTHSAPWPPLTGSPTPSRLGPHLFDDLGTTGAWATLQEAQHGALHVQCPARLGKAGTEADHAPCAQDETQRHTAQGRTGEMGGGIRRPPPPPPRPQGTSSLPGPQLHSLPSHRSVPQAAPRYLPHGLASQQPTLLKVASSLVATWIKPACMEFPLLLSSNQQEDWYP